MAVTFTAQNKTDNNINLQAQDTTALQSNVFFFIGILRLRAISRYEGCNFNSGNYLFTADTK